jgi:hypothetical protein
MLTSVKVAMENVFCFFQHRFPNHNIPSMSKFWNTPRENLGYHSRYAHLEPLTHGTLEEGVEEEKIAYENHFKEAY